MGKAFLTVPTSETFSLLKMASGTESIGRHSDLGLCSARLALVQIAIDDQRVALADR
jgi:hypothetical protein